ncbi:hypothetical protein [Candidatus Formimonas warabiya]|nr:hypothetical protein [Candidatus Formimonas warabiya]
MQIAALSVLFLIIIALEVPRLVKGKMWRELVVFSVLLLAGAGLSYALALNIPVPNPTNVMEKLFEPVSQWIDKVLS